MKVLTTKLGKNLKKLSFKIKYRWDLGCVFRNESGYVSDTSGGGRVGGNGMNELNIHTPQVTMIKLSEVLKNLK